MIEKYKNISLNKYYWREPIIDAEDVEKYSVLQTMTYLDATMLYLLSESRLAIHTYPQNEASRINSYTCNSITFLIETVDIIYIYIVILNNIYYKEG